MTYTQQELNEIIRKHRLWLRSDGGGERADLSGAYLVGADLSNADLNGTYLSGTYLSRADLRCANLRGSSLHKWVQIAWDGHGEDGRMLTAFIQREGDEAVYQCGCFYGTKADLEEYIRNNGEQYAASRTRAMNIVTELLKDN